MGNRNQDQLLTMRDLLGELPEHLEVQEINSDNLLISRNKSESSEASSSVGLGGRIDPAVLCDVLLGLVKRQWSGVVEVQSFDEVKKLHFHLGSFIYAHSSAVEHRMGSVIYRNGLIKIDDLVSLIAQLSKTKKLGQLLIESGVMSRQGLWEALQSQFLVILNSVFMADSVFFVAREEESPHEVGVQFTSSSEDLIRDSEAFGATYRNFVFRLPPKTVVRQLDGKWDHKTSGSFYSDVKAILRKPQSLAIFLEGLKLPQQEGLAVLMDLVGRGWVGVDGLRLKTIALETKELQKLNQLTMSYHYVLSEVRKAYSLRNDEFPSADLIVQSKVINDRRHSCLFLDKGGALVSESCERMLAQAAASELWHDYYKHRIGLLMHFLLQMSQDRLNTGQYSTLTAKVSEVLARQDGAT